MKTHLVGLRLSVVGIGVLLLMGAALTAAQTPRLAPPDARSSGRLAAPSEPGLPLHVSGLVVSSAGTPVPGASIYAYQTDAEGYYGVKPASDNWNPRLKVFLIVFEGDPFVTSDMRKDPAFSVRPIDPGRAGGPARVTERIVLTR